MTTLRKELTRIGFNWSTGRILYQESNGNYPGWSSPIGAEFIDASNPVLDVEFGVGYGGPECPRFIAEDGIATYFPDQYDGSTDIVRIYRDINMYLDFEQCNTPYPGGG